MSGGSIVEKWYMGGLMPHFGTLTRSRADGIGTETRERRQTAIRRKKYLMKYLEERRGTLDNCKSCKS